MIDRPDYIRKIEPFINNPIIKVLTGLRRSGKTCLLKILREWLYQHGTPNDAFVEIDFESRKHDFRDDYRKVYDYIRKRSKDMKRRLYLMFDEIEELPDWELLVNTLFTEFNVDIYLTGSNSKLFSSELGGHLSGRYVTIPVFPLSFKEVYSVLQPKGISTEDAFNTYLTQGGMPFIYDTGISGEAVRTYLLDVFHSVILKDIAQRHRIRESEQLERFITCLISAAGNEFSAQEIQKTLKKQRRKLASETLYNYLGYCSQSCLTQHLRRQNITGKTLLSTMDKIYLTDHGIREALLGSNLTDIERILQNIVAMELRRRDWNVTTGTVKNQEIDFIAEKGSSKLYVQVAYLMPTEETRERQFSPLLDIRDNFPKLVLSMDTIDFSRDGIHHKRITDFLMQ